MLPYGWLWIKKIASTQSGKKTPHQELFIRHVPVATSSTVKSG